MVFGGVAQMINCRSRAISAVALACLPSINSLGRAVAVLYPIFSGDNIGCFLSVADIKYHVSMALRLRILG